MAKKRDYAKENRLRRARKQAYGTAPNVKAELTQIKRAVESDYRRTWGRKQAAELVAKFAGVKHQGPKKKKATRREFERLDRKRDDREAFIKAFLELELGTKHEAYTLWYSP